jgi:hypothetical protein
MSTITLKGVTFTCSEHGDFTVACIPDILTVDIYHSDCCGKKAEVEVEGKCPTCHTNKYFQI